MGLPVFAVQCGTGAHDRAHEGSGRFGMVLAHGVRQARHRRSVLQCHGRDDAVVVQQVAQLRALLKGLAECFRDVPVIAPIKGGAERDLVAIGQHVFEIDRRADAPLWQPPARLSAKVVVGTVSVIVLLRICAQTAFNKVMQPPIFWSR